MQTRQAWIERCSGVLKGNLPDRSALEKLPYRYTCPAREKGTYLPQWLWDSCFHAIVYRWFDPGMAWEELQSLFVHHSTKGPMRAWSPTCRTWKKTGPWRRSGSSGRGTAARSRSRRSSRLRRSPCTKERRTEAYWQGSIRNCAPTTTGSTGAATTITTTLWRSFTPWESGWDASQRWDGLMGRIRAARPGSAPWSREEKTLSPSVRPRVMTPKGSPRPRRLLRGARGFQRDPDGRSDGAGRNRG